MNRSFAIESKSLQFGCHYITFSKCNDIHLPLPQGLSPFSLLSVLTVQWVLHQYPNLKKDKKSRTQPPQRAASRGSELRGGCRTCSSGEVTLVPLLTSPEISSLVVSLPQSGFHHTALLPFCQESAQFVTLCQGPFYSLKTLPSPFLTDLRFSPSNGMKT